MSRLYAVSRPVKRRYVASLVVILMFGTPLPTSAQYGASVGVESRDGVYPSSTSSSRSRSGGSANTGAVLNAIGGVLQQMSRDNELQEQRRQQEAARRAEEQRLQQQRAQQQAHDAMETARNDPSLNPFSSGQTNVTSGMPHKSSSGTPSPVTSGAPSQTALPACTDAALTPHFNKIAATVPTTVGICDSARAAKKAFSEMLKLIAHCPDTGSFGAFKSQLKEQLQDARAMEQGSCG